MCDAKLTTVFHASCGGDGTQSELDYLYFNVIPTTTNHAPYYHLPNQMGAVGAELGAIGTELGAVHANLAGTTAHLA